MPLSNLFEYSSAERDAPSQDCESMCCIRPYRVSESVRLQGDLATRRPRSWGGRRCCASQPRSPASSSSDRTGHLGPSNGKNLEGGVKMGRDVTHGMCQVR